jgi:hypothetical protein
MWSMEFSFGDMLKSSRADDLAPATQGDGKRFVAATKPVEVERAS